MGESSARASHQDTVNVRQYDQLNVNPDETKTATQSDELKKIVEHKENKSIFEQPGKDEKLYPSEIKTLSVELSDDDVQLESMALELQQGGLVTVGDQKVILDEAVAQGLLPGHTAIKLMEKAGLFGGFLDINTCKSLSVEDVIQEGLLDKDLMACVLHSEKILAGVIDVEHWSALLNKRCCWGRPVGLRYGCSSPWSPGCVRGNSWSAKRQEGISYPCSQPWIDWRG